MRAETNCRIHSGRCHCSFKAAFKLLSAFVVSVTVLLSVSNRMEFQRYLLFPSMLELRRRLDRSGACIQDMDADYYKIYPTSVTPFTTIEKWYREGRYDSFQEQ